MGPALVGRGFQVLAVDLRGHGASPRTVAGLSVAGLAADVAATVGDEPVDLLVGHSLGALVALELVGRRPGFARRLVVGWLYFVAWACMMLLVAPFSIPSLICWLTFAISFSKFERATT